jgi:hypothetical protein
MGGRKPGAHSWEKDIGELKRSLKWRGLGTNWKGKIRGPGPLWKKEGADYLRSRSSLTNPISLKSRSTSYSLSSYSKSSPFVRV